MVRLKSFQTKNGPGVAGARYHGQDLRRLERKAPAGAGGLGAGASDLRDQTVSRDRRYNDRLENLVPSGA